MELIQALLLALIQGITEFLPISSSAHLILPSQLLGWPDQGLAFDVAVHVGTLAAVMIYFRQDIVELTKAWFGQFAGQGVTNEARLGWAIIVATIPAGLAGLLFDDVIEQRFRSIAVIAMTTIVFGIALGLADKFNRQHKSLAEMTLLLALVVGMFQALALIPGTSRSGITITAALLLGFTRVDAAKFSFLLSIPVILLSGGYKSIELLDQSQVDWFTVGMATLMASVSAYICIHYFLSFIARLGMLPFVIYRLLLGGLLFTILLTAS